MNKRNIYALYLRESDRGNGFASWKLAMMYQAGNDCEQNQTLALQFLETAAYQESTLAKRELALAVLDGRSVAMSQEDALNELLGQLHTCIDGELPEVFLNGRIVGHESEAADALRRFRMSVTDFKSRFLLAHYELTGVGLPTTAEECIGLWHSSNNSGLAHHENLEHRCSVLSYFYPPLSYQDGSEWLTEWLLGNKAPENIIDAFILARSWLTTESPEVMIKTQENLSSLMLKGNSEAKALCLANNLPFAEDEVAEKFLFQLFNIVEERPEIFNAYTLAGVEQYWKKGPRERKLAHELLQRIQRQGLLTNKEALISVLMDLGENKLALEHTQELANLGLSSWIAIYAAEMVRKYKEGSADFETAWFWAECLTEERPADGRKVLNVLFKALKNPTEEQLLVHHSILEESVAEDNEPLTMLELAEILLTGNPVVLPNPARALELLQAAGESSPKAQFLLGQCYLNGRGTEPDEELGNNLIARAWLNGFGEEDAGMRVS